MQVLLTKFSKRASINDGYKKNLRDILGGFFETYFLFKGSVHQIFLLLVMDFLESTRW